MENKNVLKGKKTRYWLLGLAVVIIIAIFAFLRLNPARATDRTTKQTGTVTSVTMAETVDASGSLAAQPSASLTWNTSGVVEQVNVKAGDKVKAGDVLMKLKITSVDASVISAQSDLITAQKDLDDLLNNSDKDLAQSVIDLKDAQDAYDKAVKYLYYLQNDKKIPQTSAKGFAISNKESYMYIVKTKTYRGPAPEDWIIEAQNDLALKKAELEQAQHTYGRLKDGPNAQDVTAAQAKVDTAQATVNTMSIIAPFDGEVLYISNQPGDVVATGASAIDMANINHLYIESQVDESDIANIKAGEPITATLDAVPDLTLTGKVAAINPVGEQNSGIVKYTIRVDVDKVTEDVSLPLGATANVTIQVKPATTVLAVPTNLIQNDSKGEYVLVLQADGSTKRVDVVTGSIQGDLVTVTGDLKADQTVTTSAGGK